MKRVEQKKDAFIGWFRSADARQLAAAGISLSFYGLLTGAVLALSILFWIGMGILLYRLKSGDRVTLFISFGLITFGSAAFGTLDTISQMNNPLLAFLTNLLGAGYFALVILLQQVFRGLAGQESPLAVVASTLAIAALFSPVRRRVQAAIDRRFDRARYDATHALDTFIAAVRDEAVLEQITGALPNTVAHTLQPESVCLWLRGSGEQ